MNFDLSNIDPEAIRQTFTNSAQAVSAFIDQFGVRFGWLKEPALKVLNAKATSIANHIATESEIKNRILQIRGLARIAAEAQRTQERLDDIGLKALPQIAPDARPRDVSEDWIEAFIDRARLVSDPEMRTLWARILAGEANKPGSYSRRTLSVLSDLTKHEAELFTRLCAFVLDVGLPNPFDPVNRLPKFRNPLVLNFSDRFYISRGVNERDLRALDSIGLITFNPMAQYRLEVDGERADARYFSDVFDIYFASARPDLAIGYAMFTNVGSELCNIAGASANPEFLIYVGHAIRGGGGAIVSQFPRRTMAITVTLERRSESIIR